MISCQTRIPPSLLPDMKNSRNESFAVNLMAFSGVTCARGRKGGSSVPRAEPVGGMQRRRADSSDEQHASTHANQVWLEAAVQARDALGSEHFAKAVDGSGVLECAASLALVLQACFHGIQRTAWQVRASDVNKRNVSAGARETGKRASMCTSGPR